MKGRPFDVGVIAQFSLSLTRLSLRGDLTYMTETV